MAGYSRIYVIGGQGGFMGADGVRHPECMLLVGEGSRQWFEPRYLDKSISAIGKLRSMVPAGPADPDSLLDACIALFPRYFKGCPSLEEVESELRDREQLDFDADPKGIPAGWVRLREEARPLFANMGIWQADLVPLQR